MQAELPIWVGGGGERRTLRIAAKYADGWNVPFVSPETIAHKRAVLADHCSTVGRDPSEIRTAVNVGLCRDDDALVAQFGQLAERVRPGVMIGSPDQLVQRMGEYVDGRRRSDQHRHAGPLGPDPPRPRHGGDPAAAHRLMVRAWAPGRVNLMGDHTDHTGGLVLPLAIDLGTTVTGRTDGDLVELRSPLEPQPAVVPRDVDDPAALAPAVGARTSRAWSPSSARRPASSASSTTTLPVGAGLSSSAALEVAVALALGFDGPALELARLCQRAEQRASGVPCGIMDQLASAAGVEGHALRIDCTTLELEPVPLPDDIEVVVVDSGQRRELATSAYAERARDCQAAQAEIGPLRAATPGDLARLSDVVVRRRARHVISENERVDELATALVAGDRGRMAEVMADSHRSLRDDFEVSTDVLDALVDRLTASRRRDRRPPHRRRLRRLRGRARRARARPCRTI